MARRVDKEKVLKMRIEGQMSYSQIKAVTGICKSTLSDWLAPYPLSKERIRELGPLNERRIENCRNTKRILKDKRLAKIYEKASNDIGYLNRRELFIAGLFLYWGEGKKTFHFSFSNTDPAMIKFFLKWLKVLGVSKENLNFRLDLYIDMNINSEIIFWSNELDILAEKFKINVKNSTLVGLTYKNGFGHGTCRVEISRQDLLDYVLQSLSFIRKGL